MEIPQNLGPSGISARITAIQREMSSRLGIAAPGSFANQLNGQMTSADTGPVSKAPAYLRSMIETAAAKNNLDPDLLDCLVHQESGYDVNSRSKVGAMGLTQLMPDTASGLGVTNPFDPAQNLMGGAKYLRQQLDRFGNIPEALAAYNAGPGAVLSHGGIPNYPETLDYVKSITHRYEKLKLQQASPDVLKESMPGSGVR